MKAKNVRFAGVSLISQETIAMNDEYSFALPAIKTAIPVFMMTREPKVDRRYFRREAAL